MSIQRQRGVAVVTALLLTTLAVTIVASLFWQQQVQVRSIENQRLQAQKKWISRAAISFSRLGVKLGNTQPNIYKLDDPWAQPIKDFRISDFMAAGYRESDDLDPSLSGQLTDAQSKFNLTNLAPNGVIDIAQTAIFSRLLTILQLQPSLAKDVTLVIQQSEGQVPSSVLGAPTPPPASPPKNPAASAVPQVQSLRLTQVEDLLAFPNFTPSIIARLKPYIVILPIRTTVNINTASSEVLAAEMGVTSQQAGSVRRGKSYFNSNAEFIADANQFLQMTINAPDLQTNTEYFFVDGRVSLQHANWNISALINKFGPAGQIQTKVIWARDY